ncbi:MAG: SufD family Fe-S cluster assembly protein [Lachnospiraceae bacterium]|nr:SufD family Fe-S cluster assembly protein [Lachnospiraceae bacterium]
MESRQLQLKINPLPTLTWNFLKLNSAVIDETVTLNGRGKSTIQNIPRGVIVSSGSCEECGGCDISAIQDIRQMKTGLGAEADAFFEEVTDDMLHIRSKKNMQISEPLCISYEFADGDANAVRQEIIAEEDSRLTVIMDYTAGRKNGGFFGVQTRVKACRNSVVRLIKINLLGDSFLHFDGIAALVEEGAKVELLQMELGGGRNYTGTDIDLAGYKSEFAGNAAFLCLGDQMLDMNYYIGHRGKKSLSTLGVKGALRDRAVKNFRGTIDLKHGAKGAKGNEQEETLLLSDGVQNKTLPLILCDEDDVEGSHGATIGRLSQEMLFYMQTRGFTEHEAQVLMAKGQLNFVRDLIGDEKSVGRIQHYTEGVFGDDR